MCGCTSDRSLHGLFHQFRLGLGKEHIGGLAIDLLAADFQHDRNRKRRDMIECFMHDSAFDAREHFAKPAHVEQAGRGIGARGAQKNVIGLMARSTS